MSDPSRPPLGLKIFEALERKCNKVHAKYWGILGDLCTPMQESIMVGLGSTTPPRDREPIKVTRILGEYAQELFSTEAEAYPADDRLAQWRMALAKRIETDIMIHIRKLGTVYAEGLEYHLRDSEMQKSIWPALSPLIHGEQADEIRPEPSSIEAKPTDGPLGKDSDVARRAKLLAEYKSATGDPSNRKIYTARNSGIHKPEFLRWQRGDLPSTSQTCVNFERFLREKKAPMPRQ